MYRPTYSVPVTRTSLHLYILSYVMSSSSLDWLTGLISRCTQVRRTSNGLNRRLAEDIDASAPAATAADNDDDHVDYVIDIFTFTRTVTGWIYYVIRRKLCIKEYI